MAFNWFQARQFPGFYAAADTYYQLHSPFVFELAQAVLEDRRWYYAFRDIEAIRRKMLGSKLELELSDYGKSAPGDLPIASRVRLRRLARLSSSSPAQGRFLFRLTQFLKPQNVLELGTSIGLGTMYLAGAARKAQIISLEGSPECSAVAQSNLELLGLHQQVQLLTGPFSTTLPGALQRLKPVDLIFFDGHHQGGATLQYFEECLLHLHARSVLVFDDIYWSPDMLAAWKKIQAHPAVTFTVDCFDLGLVFFNTDLKSKQHFRLLPTAWKPWKKAHLK